jgi:hypothetical protein
VPAARLLQKVPDVRLALAPHCPHTRTGSRHACPTRACSCSTQARPQAGLDALRSTARAIRRSLRFSALRHCGSSAQSPRKHRRSVARAPRGRQDAFVSLSTDRRLAKLLSSGLKRNSRCHSGPDRIRSQKQKPPIRTTAHSLPLAPQPRCAPHTSRSAMNVGAKGLRVGHGRAAAAFLFLPQERDRGLPGRDLRRLLEVVPSEANLALALINVVRKKGALGIDGQTVEEADADAPKLLPRLRRALLERLSATRCPSGEARAPWPELPRR